MAKSWAIDDRAQLHKEANNLLDQNLIVGEPVVAIVRGGYDSAMIATEMAETRALLAELPDPDKLIAFDRNRHVMVTMAESVQKAGVDRLDATSSPVLRACCAAMAPPDGFEPPTPALGRLRSIH
jgi:hypothetical protein